MGLCLWISPGAQQGVPPGSLDGHSKGENKAAGPWRPCGEVALLAPRRARGPWLAVDSGLLICRHSASPPASRSAKSHCRHRESCLGPHHHDPSSATPHPPMSPGSQEERGEDSSRRNFYSHKQRTSQISTGTTGSFFFMFSRKSLGLSAILSSHLGIETAPFFGPLNQASWPLANNVTWKHQLTSLDPVSLVVKQRA